MGLFLIMSIKHITDEPVYLFYVWVCRWQAFASFVLVFDRETWEERAGSCRGSEGCSRA